MTDKLVCGSDGKWSSDPATCEGIIFSAFYCHHRSGCRNSIEIFIALFSIMIYNMLISIPPILTTRLYVINVVV